DDDTDDADRSELAPEIRLGALFDGIRDELHFFRARRNREERLDEPERKDKPHHGTAEGHRDAVFNEGCEGQNHNYKLGVGVKEPRTIENQSPLASVPFSASGEPVRAAYALDAATIASTAFCA